MNLKKSLDTRFGTALGEFGHDVEHLLEHVFGERPVASTIWAPRVNVYESDTEYQLEMELPGVDPASVNVELKEGRLEIWGEKQFDKEKEGFKRLRSERFHGSFRRSFEFTTQIDADKIEAAFKHGILLVTLPKSEKVLPRKIEIKVTD